jgi:ABC-2 type transport system ATP-binding protein
MPDVLALELTSVTKQFDGLVAVRNLNLRIPRGEIFGLIGPNGAGKTTTIKMIVGLLHPTAGSVRVLGHDLSEQAKGLTGYIPDDPFLYEALSAREFLTFVGRLYRMDPGKIARKVEQCFELFSMEAWGDGPAEEYSHGMRQKVVIAAALLPDPSLLVVDEPMVGLDPQSIRLVKDLLRDKAEAGVTVFVSTHTLPFVEEICDRFVVMARGEIVAERDLAELRGEAEGQGIRLEDLYLSVTDVPTAIIGREPDGRPCRHS